jgi:inorganic pyrophosphatase
MPKKRGKPGRSTAPESLVNPVELNPFSSADDESLRVVIETPKGSRNKFKFDPELRSYALAKVLPKGLVFPFDFGFVPGTKAEDGDPLDVLVLMDEPTFPGCVVQARLLGVIEADQEEDGKTERNDRLIAVALSSLDYAQVKTIDDLDRTVLDQIGHFFVVYNREAGKTFTVIGRKSHKAARKNVERHLVDGRRSANKDRAA